MSIKTRPPVITIMGHVDHGKTSLLDYLRRSRLTAREAGGITQHIGAYQVEVNGEKLTFIDTPGHAAFNKMRERGAQITDIVILVVAANDGVKPQTEEAIRHIKNAQVPCIVAINKIDLESANPLNVKSQLAEREILVTDFGGDVEVVEISAKTGQGIDKLLETIVVTAQLLELKADPAAPLQAVVIESYKDKLKGAVADIIVQNGTLAVRQDIFATDQTKGRVKAIFNDLGKNTQQIGPGDPGQITGFEMVPEVGATIFDQLASAQEQIKQQATVKKTPANDFSDLNFGVFDKPQTTSNSNLPPAPSKIILIVKADTQGTLEAIMQNIDTQTVTVVTSGVGAVSDTDIELAQTSGARIIAFQVKVDNRLITAAKNAGVKIKQYQIIYELIEDLQKQMLKLMEPTIDEKVTGEIEILQIFEMKGLRIAGIRVRTGEIKKTDLLHLKRGDEIIANPVINSMMKDKQETVSIKAGNEGALTFKNKRLDFQVGDLITAYIEEDF